MRTPIPADHEQIEIEEMGREQLYKEAAERCKRAANGCKEIVVGLSGLFKVFTRMAEIEGFEEELNNT